MRNEISYEPIIYKRIPALRADLWQCWSKNCSHLESYKPSGKGKKKKMEIFMQWFLSNRGGVSIKQVFNKFIHSVKANLSLQFVDY